MGLTRLYRIVSTNDGYQAQYRDWYWPVWRNTGKYTSKRSIELAEAHARAHARNFVVVKYVDVELDDAPDTEDEP